MSIEALPFVNWIFWMSLTAGSILVVGVTELLGGTTRGYRLFMACLLAGLAAVLLISELNLPPGTVADATADVRRILVLAFAALVVAHLVVSLVNRSRGWLATGAGWVGLGALVALAAAGGTLSEPLFATQLIVASLALGAVNAAMLLGHWYLVTPKLSPAPLRRMMWIVIGALVLQAAAAGVAFLTVGSGVLGGALGWLTWLRVGVGIALPVGITVLALFASRAASLQASTGLLYIGLALVMAGSIAGSSLTYLTGVPV